MVFFLDSQLVLNVTDCRKEKCLPRCNLTIVVAKLWPKIWKLSQPYFGQVWGWSPTLGKSEDLESSETPECSELDNKAQNTSHLVVLGVIEKVLKLRYRKWPRIGHLDICSLSYGQKKGRESNCQFDSDH
jgi:hypothetical protein